MSQPPQYQTSIFNSSYFIATNGALTLTTGDKRYVKIGSSALLTSVVLGGNTLGSTEAGYLTSITTGTAQASKALVLNSSSSITAGLADITQSGNHTLSGTSSIIALSGTSSSITCSNTAAGTSAGTGSVRLQGGIYCAQGCYIGGTGLDVAALKFGGTTFDQTLNTSITQGSATKSKALVLNSSGQITGIPYLSGSQLNATLKVTGSHGDFGSISISSTTVIDSSRSLVNIGTVGSGAITCSALTVNGVTITTNGSSQSNVYSIGSGSVLSTSAVCSSYNLICQNQSDAAGVGAGLCFAVDSSSTLNSFTPSATIIAERVSGSYAVSDLVFYTRSAAGATSAMTQRMRVSQNGNISFSDYAGDSDWNFIRANAASNIRYGCDISANNCISLAFKRIGNASASNGLAWEAYGSSNTLWLGVNNRVGIGNQTPTVALDVSSYVTVSMLGPLAAGTSSSYAVNQSGTYSDNVGIYCLQELRVGSRGLYVGSDRRAKEDITDIPNEDGLEFVQDIVPKVYKLRETDRYQLGYISQNFIGKYGSMLHMMPDEKMKRIDEDDVEGCYIHLDYMRVIPMLHAALRKAFDEIEELKASMAALI